ncbi:MAG: M15 family metallopeptidase [Sulfurovum sp.]|uniref:M15 family metallopeptidase n=1 Tax=Sulfurovum sp. TaxID=1969726 RepID=UPI0028680F0D|nr:M15 family metallopeptidase [Sulfurovum sp.]MCO4846007.1 M15 family metallopeptidase [Sulfurovum sp.]
MIRIITIALVLTSTILAEYSSSISPITPEIKKRMIKGNSWRKGCPVSLNNLRYLRLKHINFNGKDVMGEIIVHKEVSAEVTEIFEVLYEEGYPINKMRLVSDYKGNDWQSIESDNTSAFNCRTATGSKKWSKHSYGKAIDINPIENPYISRKGYISHKASTTYRKRVHKNSTHVDKAVLLKNDNAVQIFKKYGWKWGGDWTGVKDYQHFSK